MRFILVLLTLISSQLRAADQSSHIRLVMTVDWEGEDLRPENLRAMQKLRKEFPKVPLLHYLNAAYFTKPGADKNLVRQQINSVVQPGDQFGVHVHGWKSLITAAGVAHRRKPSWERGGKPSSTKDCRRDCGFEIPINAYSYEELRKVLQTSKRILAEQGFTGLKHFRAGGWVTSPGLLEALAAEGFVTDSSAVPLALVADELVGMDLLGLLRAYWSQVTTDSQPYLIKTTQGALWQVPNNAALADYMDSKETLAVVEKAMQNQGPRYVIAGFHQETADDWHDRVRGFLQAAQKIDRLSYTIMPESFP